jgi:hypothetical protein
VKDIQNSRIDINQNSLNRQKDATRYTNKGHRRLKVATRDAKECHKVSIEESDPIQCRRGCKTLKQQMELRRRPRKEESVSSHARRFATKVQKIAEFFNSRENENKNGRFSEETSIVAPLTSDRNSANSLVASRVSTVYSLIDASIV